jgi:predicted transcriptional regulator
MRLDSELVAQLDAMADQRELDRTGMFARTLDVAVKARQRACSQTHRIEHRCGECGLLVERPTTTDNL